MTPRAVLFLTVFIHLLGFGILLPLLPYYAETYGANGTAVGLLNTSFSLMQFGFSPIWGRLSDRVGRRPVIFGSLVVTAGSYLMFALATSLPVLFASRILAGIAGGVIPTTQAYIADTTTPAERTKGMGLLGAAFGLGFIFGPALGGVLSRHGYSVPAFVACGLSLLAALSAYFVLPESLPRAARAAAIASRRSAPTLLEALRRPAVGLVLVLFFVGTLAFSILEGTFALFGEHDYGLSARDIGYFFAYVGSVSALMQAGIVGALAKRFGERALVIAGFALMAVAMTYTGSKPLFPLLLLAMGILSVGNGLTTPSLAGLVSIASTPDEQGGILGVYQSLGSLARAIGPFIGGVAFDRLGHGSPYLVAGLLMAVGVVLGVRIPSRSRVEISGRAIS
ncbi:MAG: MFS transporter [Candidatus Latescibacteria bacterium]|nr:MFS transporter [Candidatus Latescibacterota bacterium]